MHLLTCLLECRFEETRYSPHSPDWTQRDYHSDSRFKEKLIGQRFSTDGELKMRSKSGLRDSEALENSKVARLCTVKDVDYVKNWKMCESRCIAT